jgi:hypothetical protein
MIFFECMKVLFLSEGLGLAFNQIVAGIAKSLYSALSLIAQSAIAIRTGLNCSADGVRLYSSGNKE